MKQLDIKSLKTVSGGSSISAGNGTGIGTVSGGGIGNVAVGVGIGGLNGSKSSRH